MDPYALQQQKNRKLNEVLRRVVADGKRASERAAKSLETEKKKAMQRKMNEEREKEKMKNEHKK